MNRLIALTFLTFTFTACIPDNVKEKMNEGLMIAQQMVADQEFKKAIAQVELHKLRNGSYPNSLSELQFLSSADSTIFTYVEYNRLDTVYELNLKRPFLSMDGSKMAMPQLNYPPDFWKGLGCIKSNLK